MLATLAAHKQTNVAKGVAFVMKGRDVMQPRNPRNRFFAFRVREK
jgi:hypothetical protein